MSETSACCHPLSELSADCMEAIIYSAALRSHKHPNWEGEGAVEQGIADVARHCAKIDCTSKGEVYFAHFTLLNVMPAIPDVRAVRNVEDIISGVELFPARLINADA